MHKIDDNPAKIEPIFNELKQNFLKNPKTRDLKFRKQQLKNFLRGMKEMSQEIHEACEKDLGYKNLGVTELFSIVPTMKTIEHTLANLDSYAAPRKVKTNLLAGSGKSSIVPEPFGAVLVIGSWNYPVFTALSPAAEAIAAGNVVVLKPSELAPENSRVIKEFFNRYLDPAFYRVIEGGLQVAIKITSLQWDLIIFTGSSEKGKLVAQAAAKNLVPCILELGGKSPTIIDNDADIYNAALRIAVTKYSNAGQTCVAPDFIFLHEDVQHKFMTAFKEQLIQQFSEDPKTSSDYSRIVQSNPHTQRLADMIKEVESKIVIGGQSDVKDRYIAPTVALNPGFDCKIMKEEIFGPIMPVITYKDIKTEVIDYINSQPKPLSLYYFGKRYNKLVAESTSSGAYVQNDCVMHVVNSELPFGGVGNSGMGALHGKWGFDSCSHLKPVLNKDSYNGFPMHVRFPPYTQSKISLMKRFGPFGNVNNEDIQSGIIMLIIAILFFIFVFPKIMDKFALEETLQGKDL